MAALHRTAGIVFLSLTGNTKTMAEKIGAQLGAHGYDVSYLDLMDRGNRERFPLSIDPGFIERSDIAGFGCFAAEYQPPFMFKKMLDGLGDLRGKHCFIFCTYGAEFGYTLESMRKSLEARGAIFLGGDAFASSDEVKDLALNRLYLRHDRPDEVEFSQARAFANQVAANSVAAAAGNPLPPAAARLPRSGRLLTLAGRYVFSQRLLQRARRFRIVPDRCTGCGWCVRICPSLSLSFAGGAHVPSLDGNCQGCAICYECPHQAIVPESAAFSLKLAATWARLFYRDIDRKVLDDRELQLLEADRFAIMKSRPELMKARRAPLSPARTEPPSP